MDTIGGVVFVENPDSGAWHDNNAWNLDEEFRVGGSDGAPEVLFGGPLTSVSVGPGGLIHVLDFQAHEIRVFDREGKFVRRIGRRGAGPGEFAAPSAMAWDRAERLWVSNGFNGRYTVFDSAGVFIKTVPRPIRVLARLQHPLTVDAQGHFLDETASHAMVTLLRIDTAGAVIDTVADIPQGNRPEFSGIIPPGFDREALNYLSSTIWAASPDGTLWLAESGRLRLVHRTFEGDTLRIVNTRHRARTIDPVLRSALEREFDKLNFDRSQYSLAWPIVQSVHILDDGHVLVQVAAEPGRPGHELDVFDPEGRFLGTMSTRLAITTRGVPAIIGDTIVAIGLGDLDVPYLVRLTIRRSSR